MRTLTSLLILTALIATPAFAQSTRTLKCENSSGEVSIGICGVGGCTATVQIGDNAARTYRVNRRRNASGSLVYTPRAGSSRRCTIHINALTNGIRKIRTISCASTLVGANCNIA